MNSSQLGVSHNPVMIFATSNWGCSSSSSAMLRRVSSIALQVSSSFDRQSDFQGQAILGPVALDQVGTALPSSNLIARDVTEGREIRTVEVDPERAHLVTWAFHCRIQMMPYSSKTIPASSCMRTSEQRGWPVIPSWASTRGISPQLPRRGWLRGLARSSLCAPAFVTSC